MKGPVAAISAVVLAFAFGAFGTGTAFALDTPPEDPIVESAITPVAEPVVDPPAEDPIASSDPVVEEVATLTVEDNPDPEGPDPKVVVCKYTGTPFVDEVRGPTIEVSANAIGHDWDGVTFPWAFNDAQDHSIAIGLVGDVTDADCPDPQGPPTDVCPNIEDPQEVVPEGYYVDDKGNCVLPPDGYSEYTEWEDGDWGCDDTTVKQTRERVDIAFYVNRDGQLSQTISDPVIETQTRDLTTDEQFTCPAELALTGSDGAWPLAGGLLATLLGAALVATRIKRPHQA